jgi:ABC-type uncharacterized transport system fused permease/ATPase subunit
MYTPTNYPLILLVLSFFALWLSARVGLFFRRRQGALDQELREDFGFILGSTLTLLGLIIGFSFSMATSRYDQRKVYEEAEANAIGTEYLRADLLPAADAAAVRSLLRKYLDERIKFYMARSEGELQQIKARTTQLQTELWAASRIPAAAKPTPLTALVLSGMLVFRGQSLLEFFPQLPPGAMQAAADGPDG